MECDACTSKRLSYPFALSRKGDHFIIVVVVVFFPIQMSIAEAFGVLGIIMIIDRIRVYT